MFCLRDEELVAMAASGDHVAFEELVSRHDARLRKRVATRLYVQVLRCLPLDDVMQDIWLAVFRGLGRIRPNGPRSFEKYLNGIARFKELSALRQYYRDRRSKPWPGEAVDCEGDAQESACPLEQASKHEMRKAIAKCMVRLPPGERDAVRLHLKGRSSFQIGREIGVSVDAAWHRVKRGLQKLIRCLGEKF